MRKLGYPSRHVHRKSIWVREQEAQGSLDRQEDPEGPAVFLNCSFNGQKINWKLEKQSLAGVCAHWMPEGSACCWARDPSCLRQPLWIVPSLLQSAWACPTARGRAWRLWPWEGQGLRVACYPKGISDWSHAEEWIQGHLDLCSQFSMATWPDTSNVILVSVHAAPSPLSQLLLPLPTESKGIVYTPSCTCFRLQRALLEAPAES